jgi:cytidyltransferase-like protein
MTRVYADMVGDLFHRGHVEFLRRARELGDELVIGVHSDEAVMSYKRAPVQTMEERVSVVASCRYVDEVLPNAPVGVSREWIELHRLDLVVHGDDFDEEASRSQYGEAMELGIFRVVPYTPEISTTDLIDRIKRRLAAGDL